MGESVVVGLLGAAAGVALGYAGAAIINAIAPKLTATLTLPTGQHIATPAGVSNPPSSHTVSVPMVASVSADLLLAAVLLAVAGGLLAGTFGSWRIGAAARPPRPAQGGMTSVYELTDVVQGLPPTGSRPSRRPR